MALILATDDIEGVTFTGGEPFAQARALRTLAERVRAAGLSVFVFTGYSLGELTGPEQRDLLAVTDVLVAGRYISALRAEGLAWRGSANQRIHFLTSRYDPSVATDTVDVEILIGPDGTMAVTGFPRAGLFSDR